MQEMNKFYEEVVDAIKENDEKHKALIEMQVEKEIERIQKLTLESISNHCRVVVAKVDRSDVLKRVYEEFSTYFEVELYSADHQIKIVLPKAS